jgi:hypothetical protein
MLFSVTVGTEQDALIQFINNLLPSHCYSSIDAEGFSSDMMKLQGGGTFRIAASLTLSTKIFNCTKLPPGSEFIHLINVFASR